MAAPSLTRLSSLDGSVVGFGPPAPPSGLSSRPGIGVAGPVHMTRDGVAVVSSRSTVRLRWRRSPISRLGQTDLPPNLMTIARLRAELGADQPLSIDVTEPADLEPVLRAVRSGSTTAEQDGAESNLWLCHRDLATLRQWRSQTDAKLVLIARRAHPGLERLLAELAGAEVDGLRLPHTEWSGGHITLAHRFKVRALGSGATHDREFAALIDSGIDAVYGDRIETMITVIDHFYPLDRGETHQ